jgi:hypothetical protein
MVLKDYEFFFPVEDFFCQNSRKILSLVGNAVADCCVFPRVAQKIGTIFGFPFFSRYSLQGDSYIFAVTNRLSRVVTIYLGIK